jgi:2-polyprenyl-3-methyl-5-hydroxy-6-metoxy-1,4-benzoquinol methylase
MNYRDKFYSKYVSAHTRQLYGEQSLDDIKKQFPVWQKYFGRFLPLDKNAKILDLGCGNGGFVWWLQKIGYQNTEGVDISEEQVQQAEKLRIENIFHGNFLEFLKNKKEVYEVIFARDVLEHFNKEEILDALGAIFVSLKKGGVFIAQTVNAENLLWGRLRHGDFIHELAFTKESITQILTVTGFNEIKIYPQRPVIHGLKSLIRFILWKYIELELKFYLLIETGSAKGIFTQNLIAVARK